MRIVSFSVSILILLLLTSLPVNAVSIWDGLVDRPIYYINIEGYSLTGAPPWNPFNDSSITRINIGYSYNETHTFNKYYENGIWKEGFYLKHQNPKPFTLSDWNLSKVLEEYQWGVEKYLPNITGKFAAGEWKKGYWNSSIARWNVIINAHQLKITLNTMASEGSGEFDEYITFECWRNESNVTCKWNKPVFKLYPSRPPIGKDTTTSTTKEENKTCGPALLVGLALVPIWVRRWHKR